MSATSQWDDPVGEALGILETVLVGWGNSLPRDAYAALDRARVLLAGSRLGLDGAHLKSMDDTIFRQLINRDLS